MASVWRAHAGEEEAVASLLGDFRDWLGRPEPSNESLVASVGRLIADRDTEYLLAAVDSGGAPEGVCQLRFRFSVWHAGCECCLEDLFVRTRGRRHGIGAALVEAAIASARERRCGRLQLDVNEGNRPALALYERLGFRVAQAPGAGRNVLMRLDL